MSEHECGGQCREAQVAAEYGKSLLEENQELRSRMEDLRANIDKTMEACEQETHCLQMKLEQKSSLERWYSEEVSSLKQQQTDRHELLQQSLETARQQEASKYMRQIQELRSDLEQATATTYQQKQKITELETLVQEHMNQSAVDVGSRSFGLSEEVTVLQEEIATMQNENTQLQSQLIDRRAELAAMVTETEVLRGKLLARDEELEDVQCQFTNINNSLEQVRMEKLDLKCQLDALQMEASSHKSKGNSIFAELDDRRIDAEKKLISLQRRLEQLNEKYLSEKQLNTKYKRQISQLLLSSSGSHFDDEYVANLQRQLNQARNEIKTLLEQVQSKDPFDKKAGTDQGCSEKMSESEYTQYMKTIIESNEKELESLKKELSTKSMQLLDVRSLKSAEEAKSRKVTTENDKLRSQNVRLIAKVEELRLKYEPETMKKSEALVVKRTEKIPLDDEVKIRESRLNNTTVNQSQTAFDDTGPKTNQSERVLQPGSENLTSKSLLSYVKKKCVSISDSDEVHYFEGENKPENDADKTGIEQSVVGRKVTVKKHISAPKDNVNECKSQ
ncbi:protein Spindly-like [Mya arenaria]|uniref:protein Spindly-like n=1 Tax=Mya arenaria TaxID=6604 RepID=UPI0022DEACFE|nr:protein Spindly-like [Mya arenaria]XP_052805979.1 protein Spindly-like [Mya arenaria]XP_052805980.1 protein Spindly-like [Mya arenaria]